MKLIITNKAGGSLVGPFWQILIILILVAYENLDFSIPSLLAQENKSDNIKIMSVASKKIRVFIPKRKVYLRTKRNQWCQLLTLLRKMLFTVDVRENNIYDYCHAWGVTLAQLVKASVCQADVQRFQPHLGHIWLSCDVSLSCKVQARWAPSGTNHKAKFAISQRVAPVAIQTWSICKVYT